MSALKSSFDESRGGDAFMWPPTGKVNARDAVSSGEPVSVKKSLILAAGNGTRLKSDLRQIPKPLMPVGGLPLLRRVVLNARQAGIDEFVIVVGHLGQAVQSYFAEHPVDGAAFQWVQNEDYEKANGISALKASEVLREPFLLLMSDHIFDPLTARRLLEQPLPENEVILGVDFKLDRIFDIDDATKVRVAGDRIVDIGKSLREFDAVDTGMFLCRPVLFEALRASLSDGDCALSDGIRVLARQGRMRAFDVRDALWFDVDTPEAVRHAEAVLRLHPPAEREPVRSVTHTGGDWNVIR